MGEPSDIGRLVRAWRELRGCNQRELAERTGLSIRHLSFVETGRAAPSRDAVLWIAQALAIPPAETGLLLEAAGFVAPYPTPAPGGPGPRAELERLLAMLDPRPAMLHDVYGTVHAYNRSFEASIGRLVALDDYAGEHDGLRLVADLRPHVRGWEQLMEQYVRRLHDELYRARGDTRTRLQAQLDRLARVVPAALVEAALDRRSVADLVLALDVRLPDGELHLETTTLTIGTPINLGMRQLRVLLFAPRDRAAAARIEALIARRGLPGG